MKRKQNHGLLQFLTFCMVFAVLLTVTAFATVPENQTQGNNSTGGISSGSQGAASQNDSGLMNGIGNAARDAGDAVGDVINGIGNAARDTGNAVGNAAANSSNGAMDGTDGVNNGVIEDDNAEDGFVDNDNVNGTVNDSSVENGTADGENSGIMNTTPDNNAALGAVEDNANPSTNATSGGSTLSNDADSGVNWGFLIVLTLAAAVIILLLIMPKKSAQS